MPPIDTDGQITVAGTLPCGRPVHAIRLRRGPLRARILTLGAIVQDLRLDGISHPLVLGAHEVSGYLTSHRYMGAVVGRYANRLGQGQFTIDGRRYQADRNFRGRHTLHGGADGADVQLWQIHETAPDRVTLTLRLADGHMGFPGNLDMTATLALTDDALIIELSARTDAATPCSLAHHGYFDLDGLGDIRGHRLWIAARQILEVDEDLIPTGQLLPVAGTPHDFALPRRIGDARHDHNFCLSDGPRPLRPVARLTGQTRLTMEVATTAPGLQLYDGAHLQDLAGLDGRIYGPHAGVALEAQHWPDAPNHPDFPDAILRPGLTDRQVTRYRFATGP